MKKFIVPAAILSILLVFSACSDFTVTFDNVTNNRSSGNFYVGNWSYTDDCIYRSFDDGLYEYDLENETIVKIADYVSIEGITAMQPYFSAIPEGFVILSNQYFDVGNMEYDEKTDTYTAVLDMYVVNYKGEVKKTITLENSYDESNNNIDNSCIDYFVNGFMIDNGWIYGQNNMGWLRYNIDTEETQPVAACNILLCIVGEYIYYDDIGEDIHTLHRIKESDLSGEEHMFFKLWDDDAGFEENTSYFFISADGTILCRKSKLDTAKHEWFDHAWYFCKFGEEPKLIGDGLGDYDISYADGYFYAIRNDENPDYDPADPYGRPYLESGEIYRINSETFEQKLIYSGEMYYPVMIGEKYLVIEFETDSAIVYTVETGETIYLKR